MRDATIAAQLPDAFLSLGGLVQNRLSILAGSGEPCLVVMLPHRRRIDVYAHLGERPTREQLGDLFWLIAYESDGAWVSRCCPPDVRDQFLELISWPPERARC